MNEIRKFTIEELSSFNGKSGKPAYVAYRGKVYNVTGSEMWSNGDHLGHEAGQNLTDAMEIAPHGEEALQKMKQVGVLE